MFVRNRLSNHAYYGDEAFAGDSVGLGLGQRLNSIFKKLILMYFWGKIAPDEVLVNLYYEGDQGDQFDSTFITVEQRATSTINNLVSCKRLVL